MKSSIPAIIHVSYQILVDEELNVKSLNKSKFGQQIDELSEQKFALELTKHSEVISNYRPFISEQLWILMFTYQGFIGRTVHLLIDGYKNNSIENWKTDSGIKQIVTTVLNEQELEYILSLKVYAYDSMLQLIETKILNELRRQISSEVITENSLTSLDKINQILKQKSKTST